MDKRYYSLVQENNEATINIYGDITSYEWNDKGTSAYKLSKKLEALEVDTINLYINSYGGEVAEGLAIYNALRRHNAKVKTYCDGFACSIASVIFMAGDERIMSNASLLMIHNAWTYTEGNANELRKQADDLDKITQASINAYMSEVNIEEEELKNMLDNETWITPQEAFEKGFVTSIVNEKNSNKASQSVRKSLFDLILNQHLLQKEDEEDLEEDEDNNKTNDEESNEDENKDDNENEEEPKQSALGSFFNALIK